MNRLNGLQEIPIGQRLARRTKGCLAALSAGAILLLTPAAGEASATLVNGQGATAPCVGIGPIGGPAAELCAKKLEEAGFVRVEAVGATGLSVGTSGSQDGVVIGVDPGSPAAIAGLVVGDVIQTVNGKAVQPTPGEVAARRTFGGRGEKVHLRIKRGDAYLEVDLVRAPQAVSGAPASTNPFVSIHPLINWRGEFLPCMGIGPAGFAIQAYCTDHFRPFGFIKVGSLGSTGASLDFARSDSAVISAIEPGSPAAKAGLQIGDQIVAVEGQPMEGSAGEVANERLFGKAGDEVRLTIRRGRAEKAVALILSPKARKRDPSPR